MKLRRRHAVLVLTSALCFAAGFGTIVFGQGRHPAARLDPVVACGYSGQVTALAVAVGDDAASALALRRHLARMDAIRAAARPGDEDDFGPDRLLALSELTVIEGRTGDPATCQTVIADAVEACRARGYRDCDAAKVSEYGRRVLEGLREDP